MYFPMSELNINFQRQVPWTPVIWKSEIQNMESYGTSCFSDTIKVSEYPSMLKELLYTYFYNISLKLLRLTCFNIYNLPFLRFLNIWKTRVKAGSKTIFDTLWAPPPIEFQFSAIIFHSWAANQVTNETMPVIFFFSNIFWIIHF